MSSVPRFEIDRPVPRRPHYALRAGALGFVLGTVAAILAAGVFTIAAAGGTSGAVSQISPSEGAQSGSGAPDPHSAPQAPEGRAGPDNGADSSPEADTDLEAFSRSVNSDVQRAWEQTFAAKGMAYRPARLALYSGAVHTA